tara:strand:+ start:723 stop:1073 length:351 start_codon:yes stop_codon:yes gene_type:complete
MSSKIVFLFLLASVVYFWYSKKSDSVDFKQKIKEGAIILDVRSPGEFASGHIENSINIPVNDLSTHLDKIPNKEQVIITCCASGMRSAKARNILQSSNYIQVYNGGGWASLQNKIR